MLASAIPLAQAVQPGEVMADPAKEPRARELSRELRCMVCQNQSIDDADATLAKDLPLLVRERIGPATATIRCWAIWWRATASSCC
jgi:cytochrome c-type biogenesis protein CcmH